MKKYITLITLCLTLLALLLTTSTTQAGTTVITSLPSGVSGIEGETVLTYIMPFNGVINDGIFGSVGFATIRVTKANGNFVTDVQTDGYGFFAVQLPQGRYYLTPISPYSGGTPISTPVTVRKKKAAEATVGYFVPQSS